MIDVIIMASLQKSWQCINGSAIKLNQRRSPFPILKEWYENINSKQFLKYHEIHEQNYVNIYRGPHGDHN